VGFSFLVLEVLSQFYMLFPQLAFNDGEIMSALSGFTFHLWNFWIDFDEVWQWDYTNICLVNLILVCISPV
jgi:hypothetical protein